MFLFIVGVASIAVMGSVLMVMLFRHIRTVLAKRMVGCTVLAKYKWDGIWYPATVFAYENADNKFVVKFIEWGCLQMGTSAFDIAWNHNHHPVLAGAAAVTIRNHEENHDDIFLASRRGDLDAVKQFVLHDGIDPNSVELVEYGTTTRGGSGGSGCQGRSALYWAALTGKETIVEFLLTAGAIDKDDSAYAAATCATPVYANTDSRDLLFDPDSGAYSSGGDGNVHVLRTDGTDDVSRRIRFMLTRDKLRRTTTTGSGETITVPTKQFMEETKCAVCFEDSIASRVILHPCGHSGVCPTCVNEVVRIGSICPLCRCEIQDIVMINKT